MALDHIDDRVHGHVFRDDHSSGGGWLGNCGGSGRRIEIIAASGAIAAAIVLWVGMAHHLGESEVRAAAGVGHVFAATLVLDVERTAEAGAELADEEVDGEDRGEGHDAVHAVLVAAMVLIGFAMVAVVAIVMAVVAVVTTVVAASEVPVTSSGGHHLERGVHDREDREHDQAAAVAAQLGNGPEASIGEARAAEAGDAARKALLAAGKDAR